MKKLLLLTKTLLAAALLCVGQNAWAAAGDKTTNVNFTFDGTATFTNSANWSYTKDAAEVYKSADCWVWENSSKTVGGAIENDGKQLRLSNGNFSVSLSGDAAGLKDIVTIDFDIAYGGAAVTSELLNTFIIKDVDGSAIVTESYKTGTSNANLIKSSTMGVTNDDIYVKGGATDWSKKVHFAFTFNYETKKISLKTTCSAATNTSSDFEIDMPLGTKAIGSFYVSNAKTYADRGLLLDNIVIKTEEGDYSTTKTITYNYKDNSDNDITDFMTSHGGVSSDTGENGELYTPTYPSSVIDDEYAYDYTYASGGDAFTITGDKTITLVYTKTAHPTTDVTVQYKNASSVYISDDIADDYPEGKPITYNLRKYVLDSTNGILYQTTDAMGTQHSPEAAETIVENVTATDINNVVFFAEGEEIATKSGTGASDIASRRSMGRFNSDSKICELGAGKYRFYAMMHCGNGTSGNVHATMYVKAGEEGIGSKDIMCRTNNQSLSFEFSITETKDILVQYGGGSNSGVDYIYIQKIGDVVKLNANGYATYSANYDVEVSGAKAYTAVLDFGGKTITCSEITSNKVPAGKGVLLYGTPNADVTLSITADAAALGDNDLKATTLANGTLATKGSNNYYALDGDTFKQYTGAAFVHNKAYFEVTAGGDVLARSMSIVFDGNITGVANVEAAAEAKAKEGKFIENGKLVIVKNGVKYNAAGAKLY